MNSLFRSLFIIYFGLHIPISFLIDFQAILPEVWYSDSLKWLVQDYYVSNFKDFLMVPPIAPWFASLVWFELLFQLPFFVYALIGFLQGNNNIRIPCIIYGTHLITVMVPILTTFWMAQDEEVPLIYKLKLSSVYGPWFILPLVLLVYMCQNPLPFGAKSALQSKKNK